MRFLAAIAGIILAILFLLGGPVSYLAWMGIAFGIGFLLG